MVTCLEPQGRQIPDVPPGGWWSFPRVSLGWGPILNIYTRAFIEKRDQGFLDPLVRQFQKIQRWDFHVFDFWWLNHVKFTLSFCFFGDRIILNHHVWGLNHAKSPYFMVKASHDHRLLAEAMWSAREGFGLERGSLGSFARMGEWTVDELPNYRVYPKTSKTIWLVVWNHWILWLSIYWEFHNPNWLSCFSEGLKPPTSYRWGLPPKCQRWINMLQWEKEWERNEDDDKRWQSHFFLGWVPYYLQTKPHIDGHVKSNPKISKIQG